MSWKAERTMSIVLAKHLIGVTQHPSTIIVRVVEPAAAEPAAEPAVTPTTEPAANPAGAEPATEPPCTGLPKPVCRVRPGRAAPDARASKIVALYSKISMYSLYSGLYSKKSMYSAIHRTHNVSRPYHGPPIAIQLYSAKHRYTSLYIIQLYSAIHYTTSTIPRPSDPARPSVGQAEEPGRKERKNRPRRRGPTDGRFPHTHTTEPGI
jgi:hypothetical protein